MSDKTPDRDAIQARHFAQCGREARFCAAVWIAAWVLCAAVTARFGYLPPDRRPDEPWLVLGIPGWVLFGVIIPWLVLICLTVWFAAVYLKEDEPIPDEAPVRSNSKEASDD